MDTVKKITPFTVASALFSENKEINKVIEDIKEKSQSSDEYKGIAKFLGVQYVPVRLRAIRRVIHDKTDALKSEMEKLKQNVSHVKTADKDEIPVSDLIEELNNDGIFEKCDIAESRMNVNPFSDKLIHGKAEVEKSRVPSSGDESNSGSVLVGGLDLTKGSDHYSDNSSIHQFETSINFKGKVVDESANDFFDDRQKKMFNKSASQSNDHDRIQHNTKKFDNEENVSRTAAHTSRSVTFHGTRSEPVNATESNMNRGGSTTGRGIVTEAENATKCGEGNFNEQPDGYKCKTTHLKYQSRGTCTMSKEDWGDIGGWEVSNGKKKRLKYRGYGGTVAEYISSLKQCNGCTVHFSQNIARPGRKNPGENQSKSPKVVIYGYCKHPGCKHFMVHIYSNPEQSFFLKMDIFSCQCPVNHEPDAQFTRYLNGVHRTKAKKELANTKPKKHFLAKIEEADEECILQGNLGGIKSHDVFKKARQDALKADDLHPDPFIDVFLMWCRQMGAKIYKYIQHVGAPLFIIIYCEKRQDIFKKAKEFAKKNGTDVVLFIDATGSVVMKIHPQDKRTFYHALVFHFDGEIIPLTEMLTSDQSGQRVGSWLSNYLYVYHTNTRIPFVRHIVMDYSFANVNGVNGSFNNMDLNAYLMQIYIEVTQGENNNQEDNFGDIEDMLDATESMEAMEAMEALRVLEDSEGANGMEDADNIEGSEESKEIRKKLLTYLHLCSAHLAKTMVGAVKEHYVPPPAVNNVKILVVVKRKIIEMICLLVNTHDYESVLKALRALFILLLHRTKSEGVKHAAAYFTAHACSNTKDMMKEYEHLCEEKKTTAEVDSTEKKEEKVMVMNPAPGRINSPFYRDVKQIYDDVAKSKEADLAGSKDNGVKSRKTKVKVAPNEAKKGTDPEGPKGTDSTKLKEEANREGSEGGADPKSIKDQTSCKNESKKETSERNIYHCPELAMYILTYWAFILPLWTGLCAPKGVRYNTCVAESWFSIVKNTILEKMTNLRPNRFLIAVATWITRIHKRIMLKIRTNRLARGPKRTATSTIPNANTSKRARVNKPNAEKVVSDMFRGSLARGKKRKFEENEDPYSGKAEESWNKKRKPPFAGYYQAYALKPKPPTSKAGRISDKTGIKNVPNQKAPTGIKNEPNQKAPRTSESGILPTSSLRKKVESEAETNERELNSNSIPTTSGLNGNVTPAAVAARKLKLNAGFVEFIRDCVMKNSHVLLDPEYYSFLNRKLFSPNNELPLFYPVCKIQLYYSLPDEPKPRLAEIPWVEYKCLLEKRHVSDTSELWLGSDIMESFVSIFMGNYCNFIRDMHILNIAESRALLSGEWTKKLYQKLMARKRWSILMVNPNNLHWSVLFLDHQRMEYMYLDPKPSNDSSTIQELISNGIAFVDSLHQVNDNDTKKWVEKIIAYPKQEDSYNCGVYCLFYIQHFLLNPELDSVSFDFDPEEYRVLLRYLLPVYSENMENFCFTCGQQYVEDELWVACSVCTRWCHCNEICVDKGPTFFKKLSKDTAKYPFSCKLCDENAASFDLANLEEWSLKLYKLNKKYSYKDEQRTSTE